MILKALYDYYNRCGNLAPTGMEYKEISFLIVIDEDGRFKRLERRGDAKNGQKFLVMKGVRSGTLPKPYLYWDNVEYVLDYNKAESELSEIIEKLAQESDEDKKAELAKKEAKLQDEVNKTNNKNAALVNKYKTIAEQFPEEKDLTAVSKFYENNGLSAVRKDKGWPEVEKKPTVNVSFMIEGNTKIVAENACLRTLAEISGSKTDSDDAICLITGEKCEPVTTTSPTAIIGGQATGRLVAFQINSGYDSFGKSKGLNAPISKEAESAFTTALNKLLSKDSHNKFVLGNRSFVFWGSSNDEASEKVENGLFCLVGYQQDDDNDDPNAKIEEVRKVFQSIASGVLKTNLDDRFFILGLAPNSARIAVVYWSETSLFDFASKIVKHFSDMEIIDAKKDRKPYMGLRDMLSTVTLGGKLSDVTPNLPEAVAKSIFQGTPYPHSLYASCIRRIRAENGDVRIARAAILKAYLNRLNDSNNKKIKVMLDKENQNQGYLCGRLFAVLDKIQEEANGIHSIRERFMNAASSTPSAVFATILNLSVHHTESLSNEALRIYFEKLKQEIISKISSDGFPAHLDLKDQGRFFVGYYQQRQDFFIGKDEGNK